MKAGPSSFDTLCDTDAKCQFDVDAAWSATVALATGGEMPALKCKPIQVEVFPKDDGCRIDEMPAPISLRADSTFNLDELLTILDIERRHKHALLMRSFNKPHGGMKGKHNGEV